MRSSDWSSDVCSSDLQTGDIVRRFKGPARFSDPSVGTATLRLSPLPNPSNAGEVPAPAHIVNCSHLHVSMRCAVIRNTRLAIRSEEHTSELQSLMRISYAVFCLKKKTPFSYHSCCTLAFTISTTHVPKHSCLLTLSTLVHLY